MVNVVETSKAKEFPTGVTGEYTSEYNDGQYWHPAMTIKPKRIWSIEDVLHHYNNNELKGDRGLRYHLLAQSIAGLANRAVQQRKGEMGVWFHDELATPSYQKAKKGLADLGVADQGKISAEELAFKDYSMVDGVDVSLRNLFDGYILTDIANNPESGIVASTASHVYNAIIVDVVDEPKFMKHGYHKVYDASEKTTVDGWREFKDKCNNKALVLMPVLTGQLRDFAITNNLFVINLNRIKGNPAEGQNIDLLEEVLAWLEPNSPVYGWESGVGEESFVSRISAWGHMMIPYDWAYNTTMTSLLYKERQPGFVKVVNPDHIDYKDDNKKFVAFYLTDGDNVQWMMNGFEADFYHHPQASSIHMSFGLPVDNLSMIAPDQCKALFEFQHDEYTIVQTFGGGYNYVDNFGVQINRSEVLERNAKNVTKHMCDHGVKVLALMAKDVKSDAAQAGYQAYISANDQLEGIIAVQYAPYAGGSGQIMWFSNSKGYDIPVITVGYTLWDFGEKNHEREGDPAYIAKKINSTSSANPFNLVAVHAWSRFDGDIYGPGAAFSCAELLNEGAQVVNVEELIWRVRMKFRSEQTKKYIKE